MASHYCEIVPIDMYCEVRVIQSNQFILEWMFVPKEFAEGVPEISRCGDQSGRFIGQNPPKGLVDVRASIHVIRYQQI